MANRLLQFIKPFRGLAAGPERRPRSPKRVTVLDLDGPLLRVAQAVNGTSLELIVTAPLDLPADADRNDPLVVGAAVGRALAKLRLSPAAVVMGVPRARVVLRSLKVPLIDKLPELASVVHFQVAKDLPFRPEEAVIDFKVGRQILSPAVVPNGTDKPEAAGDSTPAAPRLEALVAAVKRDVVEFYQRLAEAAGSKLVALGLLPYANSRCLDACEVAEGDAAFALVLLRPDEVSIDIIARQSLMFSRGATIRPDAEATPAIGTAPMSAEAYVAAAVIEAVRSLHAYGGTEPDSPVGKVVVAGATGHEAAVVKALSSQVRVPCDLLDLAGGLDVPLEFRDAAAGSVGAIGLALGFSDAGGLPFDFLNPKRPAIRRNMRRIRLLAATAGAVVFLAAVLGLRTTLIGKRMAALSAASTELADAEKKRPAYRRVINQDAVVHEWVRTKRNWLEHYAYLASVLPPSEEIY